jgi:exodeoxyribonuclease-5
VIFNRQQENALLKFQEWYKNGWVNAPYFYLAGYAGTGKTTLARYLAEGIEGEVLFAAFTGKAASVLRDAGCPGARTLHSILYEGANDAIAERVKYLRSVVPENEREKQEIEAELARLKKGKKGPIWRLNPLSPLKTAKLLVLDECSMIDDLLAEDALSFGTPILVLGDPAQLPPVRGRGYFTRNSPDHLLTIIHRQAAENPIILVASNIREGRSPLAGVPENEKVRWVRKGEVNFATLPTETQVLTGKNVVRRFLNTKKRRGLDMEQTLPQAGDKLVCLKNDREYGLLNGVICWALEDAVRVDEECISLDIMYDGKVYNDLAVASAPFDIYGDPTVDTDYLDHSLQQFDYGYALTVHKAQGSQWQNVVVADDKFALNTPSTRRRWLYTAVTRARDTLTVVE